MSVRARARETRTATARVSDSAAKNCPTTPLSSTSGRNTTTVVSVDVVTGQTSSASASRIATRRSLRSARWRAMFSVITTASSITRPMAMAIPPRLMRLNVRPISFIPNTVIAMVRGMARALMAVIRPWRRNARRTKTARSEPRIMASRTDFTASRTSAA